jgi:hypothetical protein
MNLSSRPPRKFRSMPGIEAKRFLNQSMSLKKYNFTTTKHWTCDSWFRNTVRSFELKYFHSSNHETDHIDFLIWFTPSMPLGIQSISQNPKLLSSQLLPEFGSHCLSDFWRCSQMAALH